MNCQTCALIISFSIARRSPDDGLNDNYRYTAVGDLVHKGYLDIRWNGAGGHNLLHQLARFVLVAAMYDILVTELDMSSEPGHAGVDYPIKKAMRDFVMKYRIQRIGGLKKIPRF